MEGTWIVKRCSICCEEKSWSEFGKDRTTISGYDHRCRECNRKRVRTHRLNPECKKLAAQLMSEYRRKNKEKVQARNKVHYHVKVGNMSKPEICSVCKCSGKIEAHHQDYSKPLDVIWLCNQCHKGKHNAE